MSIPGLQNLRLSALQPPKPLATDAPRGGRMPFERRKFDNDRLNRLTSTLLPYWMGLPGKFSSIGRDKIVRIMNANNGRFILPVENTFARTALNWGINNERNGIYAYMEITRHLVGLGSTRIRDPLQVPTPPAAAPPAPASQASDDDGGGAPPLGIGMQAAMPPAPPPAPLPPPPAQAPVFGNSDDEEEDGGFLSPGGTEIDVLSVRSDDEDEGEEGNVHNAPPGTSWAWADLLAATPEGFVYDVDHGNPGFLDLGLLEIKCPAYALPKENPRMHDVEHHIKGDDCETNHYYLLQMWEQLELCQDAQYVDLVFWKRSAPWAQTQAQVYIYMQRMYRSAPHQRRIKEMLKSSFGEFARALRAIGNDDTDATRDEEEEEWWQDNRATERITRRNRGDREWAVPNYQANTFSIADRAALRTELNDWSHKHMCWQDTSKAPFYPWTSKQRCDDEGRPYDTLARRYRLSDGQTATCFGQPGSTGYAVLPVNSRRMFDNEVL